MQNSILDVAGLKVGSAEDPQIATGVTALLFDEPAIAAVSTLGGAPGTRDTTLLDLEMTVAHVDALVLSGGSAFGLDAAGGVQAVLREQGRGFRIGDVTVPIVPQVILFDLLNGGDKQWGRTPPFFRLGMEAADRAGEPLRLGSAGAGYGATVAGLKGGLGTASTKTASGHWVAALVAVNAVGSPVIGDGPHFGPRPMSMRANLAGSAGHRPFHPQRSRPVSKAQRAKRPTRPSVSLRPMPRSTHSKPSVSHSPRMMVTPALCVRLTPRSMATRSSAPQQDANPAPLMSRR